MASELGLRSVAFEMGDLRAAVGWAVGNLPDRHSGTAEEELLAAERHAALRQAFAALPPCCQRLLTLLSDRRRQTQAKD